MKSESIIYDFENGALELPEGVIRFAERPWNRHPAFAGVALKHLVTAAETDSRFSYHLVRIEPGCEIGTHIHETQLETHEVVFGTGTCVNNGREIGYRPGVVSIFQPGEKHSVQADGCGLFLLAKFMPSLC